LACASSFFPRPRGVWDTNSHRTPSNGLTGEHTRRGYEACGRQWYNEGAGTSVPDRKVSDREGQALESLVKARRAVELAVDKQATDIALLDIRHLSALADYFVLCSASSERQIRAVFESVDETLGKEGVRLLRRDGSPESGWVLLDFGDLIVHVFSPEQRAYYRLDQLWKDATPIIRIQ
jgi:ribosome-associated protein